MKILLIKPTLNPTLITTTRYEPLDLEYVASSVPDYPVEIFDMRLENNLLRKLDEFKPDVVGATAYTCDVKTVKRILKEVKNHDKSINTVVGGHHATFMPQDFAEDFIDTVFIGYADYSFKNYIDALAGGGDLKQVNNIGIVEKGKLSLTEPKVQMVDLDALNFPARHLTVKYSNKYHDSLHQKISLVLTSRGCPFRCTFCACWKLMSGKYIVRSVPSVIKELKSLPDWIEVVYFADDNTLDNIPRAWELSEMIKKHNIKKKFQMYARADTIVKHPDLIESLKGAGLDFLTVGLESVSDSNLNKMNKKTTVEKNNQAIRILKKLDISIHSHFIIHPDFTEKDFSDLYQYLCDKDLYRAAFPVLTPLPGTELYEEVRDQLEITDYDFFDFAHAVMPTKLKREDFYFQLATLYKKSYSPKRLLGYHFRNKLMKSSRGEEDYYAFSSDKMGFLNMQIVRIFGYPIYLKMKNAYRAEPVKR